MDNSQDNDAVSNPLMALSTITSRLMLKDPKYLYCIMNSGLVEFIPKTDETAPSVYGDYSNVKTNNGPGWNVNGDTGSGSGSGRGNSNGREIQPDKNDEAAKMLRLVAASYGIDPNVEVGACRLACTSDSFPSSCCDAAERMRSQCQLSPSAEMYRKDADVLESILSFKSQCSSVKASTISLWAIMAVLVVLVTTLVVATRRLLFRSSKIPQQQRQREDPEDQAHAPVDVAAGLLPHASDKTWYTPLLLSWRQVSNLVWKNLRIKRGKPVAMVMEVLFPMIITLGLVLIVNADTIFGGEYTDYYATKYNEEIQRAIAAHPVGAAGFFCTQFASRYESFTTFGVPSSGKLSFYTNGQTVTGLFLVIVYIKQVSRTTAMMVIEKESRVREIMKIMGLSDGALVLSWMLTTAVMATPLSFGMAALLKFTDVLPNTSYVTLVWLFFLFSQSITAFGYFMTPFFNKSRTAAIASVLAWIVLYIPYFTVQSSSNATKYAAALSPPTALGLAMDEMLRQAQLGTGMAYDMGIKRFPIKVPTVLAMCGMLLVDIVLLFALGWYVDQVLPQEHGVAKHWNFLFTRAYWSPPLHKTSSSKAASSSSTSAPPSPVPSPVAATSYTNMASPSAKHEADLERPVSFEGVDEINFAAVVEPAPAALVAQERHGKCLQIHKLRKEFVTDDVTRVAVDDLSLTMYSGHITALLGHNGAGKTTAISMLTGLTPPTSGDATLFGRSIRTDFDELRQIMGICPQHDVLLGDLTVEDHLLMFGTMKNVPPHKLAEEADKMIREVGLVEKRSVQAKNLSGGQKRKLSVALAFIGDSKLVFLDEPTSGMDPYSRRFTWNLLQRNRDDRVIVLTTHFMDEADILGDRIAIMADGQLCCAGTSLFLKNRYGAGYNLTLIKDLSASSSSASSSAHVDAVTQFLQQFVSQAKCLSNHGSEMVFQLPTQSVAVFPDMLQALDREMATLRIMQYGVSVTTLEEVFLRIARDREVALQFKSKGLRHQSLPDASTEIATAPSSIECGEPTFGSHFSALLTKRVRITKRDRKSLLNAIGIPVLLLLIAAVIPEIRVSSFLSDYADALPSKSMVASCSLTEAPTTDDYELRYRERKQATCAKDFNFCATGVFECDAKVCCTMSDPASPFFPCNNCGDNSFGECYNPTCMSEEGAKAQTTLNSFLRATIIALAFAFIPAAIVAFVVREKHPIQNAKMLQLICGAKPAAYWLANWVHDLAAMVVPVIVTVILMPLTTRGLSSIEFDEIVAILALLVSHALVVIPMAYVVSHRYEKHSSAQTALLVLGVVTGGALSIVSFLCRMIDIEVVETKRVYDNDWNIISSSGGLLLSSLDRNYLRWIYMLFPGFSLNSGLYEIAMHRVSHTSILNSGEKATPPSFFGLFPWLGAGDCSVECWDQSVEGCCVRSVFALDVAGAPVLYALVEAVLFAALLFWLERGSVAWKKETPRPQPAPVSVPSAQREQGQDDTEEEEQEDSDVAAERARLQLTDPLDASSAVFMRNLRQQYKDGKVALDDLSLSIPKGECFGYLGINGAGKSTTMKILTGQIAPTNGCATLGGYDLAHFRDQARTVLGYCPQFDSLHDLLTVEEQLELYARLKGIPDSQVREAVDQKIMEVGLEEYRTKLTRGLSGGNKRKVSTAIALMGAPRIIFLDEPSTGVDPSSRRKMWDVIASVCAEKDSCVVLTTHSMEECEALATRVGILVGGKLKCLGSVEHLKQKFGKGYTVEVKLQDPAATVVDEMVERVTSVVAGSTAGDTGAAAGVVTQATLEQVCTTLGDASRFAAITAGDARALVLTQMLQSDDLIPVTTFCEWWAGEDLATRVTTFFETQLVGSELVEQKAADHFRFQVPKHAMPPSAIFRLLEDAKVELHVGDYSVSDTSLEHIFNTMAAQQDEEELLADGVFDPKKSKKKNKKKNKKATATRRR